MCTSQPVVRHAKQQPTENSLICRRGIYECLYHWPTDVPIFSKPSLDSKSLDIQLSVFYSIIYNVDRVVLCPLLPLNHQ